MPLGFQPAAKRVFLDLEPKCELLLYESDEIEIIDPVNQSDHALLLRPGTYAVTVACFPIVRWRLPLTAHLVDFINA